MSEDLDKDVGLPGMEEVLDTYDSFLANREDLDENSKAAILNMKELCSKYILTVSMGDYVRSRPERSLNDYWMQNIVVMRRDKRYFEQTILDVGMRMAIKARRLGAEAVVDVRHSLATYPDRNVIIIYMGTALIPKQKVKNPELESIEELFKKTEESLKSVKSLNP